MERITNKEMLKAKTIAELAQSRRNATDPAGCLALLSKDETVSLADGFMQLINERRWIPVEEALPEKNQDIWTYHPDSTNKDFGKVWTSHSMYLLVPCLRQTGEDRVTHWMSREKPLPPEPTDAD